MGDKLSEKSVSFFTMSNAVAMSHKFMLGAAATAIVFLYYILAWSDGFPVVGGDHAAYLLMADHFSPFSDRRHEMTDVVVRYIAFPPLYPMLLGLVGATSAHIVWAHLVTASFLIGAQVFYFVWLAHETRRPMLALALSIIFALIPASLSQMLGIMSEGLYLMLTLSALWLASSATSLRRWYVAAGLIGFAVVTRTAGIAMVVALAIYLLWHRIEHRWRLIASSIAPLLLWVVIKWLADYRGGYLQSVAQIIERKPLMDLVLNQLRIESYAVWVGWLSSFDPLPSNMIIVVGSALGLLCCAGTVQRIWQKRLDGIYVGCYLVVLLLWPFSIEAQRLLYVIAPLLLYHGIGFVAYLAQWAPSRLRHLFTTAYVIVVGLLAFAATGTFLHRAVLAQEPQNKPFKAYIEWYQAADLSAAREKLHVYQRLIESWRKIPLYVSETECVYHVDAATLMLYTNRVSHFPPLAVNRESYLRTTRGCRFYYLGAYSRIPYRTPFYPGDYIMDRARVIFVEDLEEVEGKPILGMLVEVTS